MDEKIFQLLYQISLQLSEIRDLLSLQHSQLIEVLRDDR